MKGVGKILIFFLAFVLLCIGIQGKAFKDVDPMKRLFAHELLERPNHESKTFSDPASKKQDIKDQGFHGFGKDISDEFFESDKDDGVNDNDHDKNDVEALSDDLPENVMNTNEEYDDDNDDDNDDYNDDDNDDDRNDNDDNYYDVDDVNVEENLSDDLPENEMNTNEEYDDNDDYNDGYNDHDNDDNDDYNDDDNDDDRNDNDDDYYDVDDVNVEENLSDDLPENEINTSEEYNDDNDYENDEIEDDDDDDYNDDDFYNNGGELKDDLPENEIFYTNGEDDNDDDYNDDYENEDEVNVDNRRYLTDDDPLEHVMSSNDSSKDTDTQRYEDESPKDKMSFIFEDNPDMSASDGISTINLNSGTVDNEDIYEGDIKVDPSREQEVAEWKAEIEGSKRSVKNVNSKRAVVNRNYRWPGKTLVYRFDSGYFGGDAFNEALQEYVRNTCIRFRRIAGLTPYHARIFRGQGCYSYVGNIRRRGGSQDVSIGDGCNFKGIIIHELMHALGFWHEQSRHDRDNYVTILWNNIRRGNEHNFDKHSNSKEETERLGVPYDYNSVMHYGSTAFARQRGLKTIVRKDNPNARLGQRNGLSPFDIRELNRYYECNNIPVTTRRPTAPPTRPTTTPQPPKPTTVRPIVLNFGTFVYVYIKSVGCRDPGAPRRLARCTDVDSAIRVNNQEYPFGSYGATVVVIDGITGKVEGSYNEQTSDIGRGLRTLGEKKLVLISVKGTWRRRSRSLRIGLSKMGLNWRRNYYRYGSYAAIGWSGPGKLSVTREVFASARRGPSVIARFIVFPLI